MTTSKLTIREINARAVLAPLKRPVRTAVGTIPSAPLVLIDVATEQGSSGRSYIFGYTPAALAPLVRLICEIAPELKGKPVAPVERMREFDRRFRTRRMAGSDRYGGLWPHIPPTDVAVGKVPVPPEGYEIARVDVVVRLRRKTINSSPTS